MGVKENLPYPDCDIGNGGSDAFYYQEDALTDDFEHGFLESPRINPYGSDPNFRMPPGEIYEIVAEVAAGGNDALFDINLATGYGEGTQYFDNNNHHMTSCYFNSSRGQTVHSTFNRAVKWVHDSQNGNNNSSGTTMSEMFVLPNLPTQYSGFNIQIGAANSDTKFNASMEELDIYNTNTTFNTCNSYYNAHGNLFGGMYYTDPIPSNFGLGLPWHMMQKFYQERISNFGICPDGLDFWWMDELTPSTYQAVDEPTLVGSSSLHEDVRIIRYSKKPYMLTSVQKKVYNPGSDPISVENPQDFEDLVWHNVSNLKLEHSIYTVPIIANYRTLNEGTNTYEDGFSDTGYERHIFQLDKIIQIPNDAEVDGTYDTAPTTHFAYDEFEVELSGAFSQDPATQAYKVSKQMVIKEIVDPLGKITTFNFYDYGAKVISFSPNFQNQFNAQGIPTESIKRKIKQVQKPVYQVFPFVSQKTIADREGTKTWDYTYSGTVGRDDKVPMGQNFKWNFTYNGKYGHKEAVVTGPSGPSTIYNFYTDRFLWGKPQSVTTKDADGNVLSENTTEYEVTLAFEPLMHRIDVSLGLQYTLYDYGEYDWFSHETPSRPLPPSDALAANYQSSSTNYISELYQYLFEENGVNYDAPPPPTPPVVYCEVPETGQLFECDCTNQDELTEQGQEDCQAYQQAYQSWQNQYGVGGFNPDLEASPDMSGATIDMPLSYETRWFSTITQNDPNYLNSYFIKKTRETSVVYDEKCSRGTEAMETVTTYDYFDTNYKGDITSSGYAELGISGTGNLDGSSRLYWSPSWQLYKTTTTSPQLPGFEESTEYFYLYDLVNHDSYLDINGGLPLTVHSNYKMLKRLHRVKKKRDFVFQQRNTKKAPGAAPIVQSTYYTYSTDWEGEAPEYTYEHIGPESLDCEGTEDGAGSGSGGNDIPPTCFSEPPGQGFDEDYCLVEESNPPIYCPCENETSLTGDPDNGGGSTSTNDPDDDDDLRPPNELGGKIFLKEVAIQVKEQVGSDFEVISFSYDTNGDLVPIFEENQVLVTSKILQRNRLGLVTITEDEKGLQTQYGMGGVIMFDYLECINGVEQTLYQVLTPNPTLPKSITIGLNLDNPDLQDPNDPAPLTTTYTYHKDNTIDEITDPNGIVLKYGYDGYARMTSAARNGIVIQEVDYSNWDNTDVSFIERGIQNYVNTTNFVTPGSGSGIKQFIDPIGRKLGSFNHSTDDGSFVSEDNAYDIWDRLVSSLAPHDGTAPDGTGVNPGDCSAATFVYDVAPRNRTLSAQGIGTCEPIQNDYCLKTTTEAAYEIQNAGNSFSGLLPPGATLLRTETTDEDGKTVVSFTNAIGQTVATIAGNGTAATTFKYDSRGNVAVFANPENQKSEFGYNYMGQLCSKFNVDSQTSSYGYDPSGNLIIEADGGGKFAAYKYDQFGRLIKQANASTQDDDPNTPPDRGLFDNCGMAWVDNRELPELDEIFAASELEKEWFYTNIGAEYISLIPSNVYSPHLEDEIAGNLGKVVQTVSFNDGNPVELKFFSYDADGFLKWEIIQFDENGVSGGSDIITKINYKNINLQGSYQEMEIDLGCDDIGDFVYNYDYDSRNRIKNVYFSYPEYEIGNFKVAYYEYHPLLLTVQRKYYYDKEQSPTTKAFCSQEIDMVEYIYDERQRLTDLNSNLLDFHIAYDGEMVDGGSTNFNGNINGITADYKLQLAGEVPLNFIGATTYGFQYDDLNRLKKADASVGFELENMDQYTGNPASFGDTQYFYDKIGNIRILDRGVINDNSQSIGNSKYIFTLEGGKNHIKKVDVSGVDPQAGNTYFYEYTTGGNVIKDEKRGIDNIGYTRGKYASYVAGVNYLYDNNDSRIYKSTGEYYLRNASGQEIGVFDTQNDKTTWYIFGNERIAKIGTNSCEFQSCRPTVPDCSEGMLAEQNTYLSGLNYAIDPTLLTYPVNLFRIQLCDDSDKYLLNTEVALLPGNYNVLQEVLITSSNQLLTVQTTDDPYAALFGDILALRSSLDPLTINSYHPCRTACPSEIFSCSKEDINAQLASVQTIHAQMQSAGTNFVEYPTNLLRLRLCSGWEIYLPADYMDQLVGNFSILQKIKVTDASQQFSVSIDNGAAVSGSLLWLAIDGGGHLANINESVNIDGYEPCYGVACDPESPECTDEEAEDQVLAIAMLEEMIETATTSTIILPQPLHRIRFCSGQEYYVFEDELQQLMTAYSVNVKYLQSYVAFANQNIPVLFIDDTFADVNIGDFLTYRGQGRIVSVDGYESCGELLNCESPDCTPAEMQQQTIEADQIVSNFPSVTVNTLTYPTKLYRVRLCGGQELYLFTDEMNAISGGKNVQQEITITGPAQEFELYESAYSTPSGGALGPVVYGTLTDLLNLRSEDKLITIGDYFPCSLQIVSQTPCTEKECTEGEKVAQQASVITLIRDVMPLASASNLNYPTNLYYLKFCFDPDYRLYVLEQELSEISGPSSALQVVPLTDRLETFNVYYNGADATATVDEILTLRYTYNDFFIKGYGCTTSSCSYEAGKISNYTIRGVENSKDIVLDYTIDIYEDCGEGIQLYESLNLTEPLVALESERNINVFADLRQDYGYLGDLTVSTLNPASTLTIDLNPNTVLTSYPGLSGTGFDPQNLIFDNQGSMATAVTTVINHAIGLWNAGALFEVDAYIPAGTDGLVIRFFVYNDPTQAYVCLSDNSQLQYYQYGDPRNVQYATPTGSASTYRPEDVNGTFISACGIKGNFTFKIDDITIDDDPQYWHNTIGTVQGFTIETNGKVECAGEIVCDNPTILCDNGSCTPCTGGTLTELVCSPEVLATLSTELNHFDVQAGQSTLSSLTVPTILYHLQFCDGSMRYVFKEELGTFSVDYITRQRIPVFGFAEQFKLEYADGTAEIGGLPELLSARPGNNDLRVSALPDTTKAGSGGDGGNNGNSGSGGGEDTQGIQVSYFIYDHLGNTRVLYHTVLDCDENEVNYILEHVVDYYPYGKVLREWQQCDQARYMTTYHERDLESGYDYRGARFYDADIGRFLSVDPLAEKLPAWSTYNYVVGNPIKLIDPNGQEPTPAEAARMAAHVYGDQKNSILTGGWKVSTRDFAIRLQDEDSGFKSQVYERSGEGGVIEYAYATAGTEAEWKDVWADVKQPFGLSEQYHNSAKNANAISDDLGQGTELTFVGHSLGGGQAALNSLITDRKAVTFNAAGVNVATMIKEGNLGTPFKSARKRIDAYIMMNDPLNALQMAVANVPVANGKKHYLIPMPLSSATDTKPFSPIDGHSIVNMVAQLTKRAR